MEQLQKVVCLLCLLFLAVFILHLFSFLNVVLSLSLPPAILRSSNVFARKGVIHTFTLIVMTNPLKMHFQCFRISIEASA